MLSEIKFSDIEGVSVGHAHDLNAGTGCTVILCKEGAAAGVDVRGGAPGTRETDLLNPATLVDKIHAVLLAGGSAFGLDAASGVMQFLEERGIGFDVKMTRVPIVCGAVLFDLGIGDFRIRPDLKMGYQACLNAMTEGCQEGNVGAGAGATVGKLMGMKRAMKAGFGAFAYRLEDLKIGALVAVNCLGDVIDPQTGEILAGLLDENLEGFANTEEVMTRDHRHGGNPFMGNTTIGTIVTNGRFTKSQSGKLASMAHDAFGRTLRPAHSMFDGDTIFALATGHVDADLNLVGMLATRAMEQAIVRAVKETSSLFGLKSHRDLQPKK